MATQLEVELFLRDFKDKMSVWQILYRDDRNKNAQTLVDLEIRPIERTQIIENLQLLDYCEGPLVETLYGGSEMWVFGKEVKKKEVYIKISMGFKGASVLCISFHIAAHSMNYPFKKAEQ